MTQKHTGDNKPGYLTPQRIFDQCNAIWGPFDLDVAADSQNKLCREFFTEKTSGLLNEWHGKCWMNPPYSPKGLYDWCHKAWHAVHGFTGDTSIEAVLVCALLPAKPEQEWWQFVDHSQHIQFIRGRVTFAGAKGCAQFPSVIVVWHKRIIR